MPNTPEFESATNHDASSVRRKAYECKDAAFLTLLGAIDGGIWWAMAWACASRDISDTIAITRKFSFRGGHHSWDDSG